MKRVFTYLTAVLSLFACIKEGPTGTELVVGDMVPDFSVTMSDGSVVTGLELSSGISCIVFFTTECPDCRQILPEVQKLYDEYAINGVRFALISREDPPESVSAYWSDNGLTMPYSAQPDRKVYELFARTRVPRVYMVENGRIMTIFTDDPLPDHSALNACLKDLTFRLTTASVP